MVAISYTSQIKPLSAFPNNVVDIPSLDYAFRSQQPLLSVTYLGCAQDKNTGDVELQFSSAPTSADQTVIDGVIAAHTGQPFIIPIQYPPVTLLVGEFSVSSETFEVVTSIFSRIESIVDNLSKSWVYVLGMCACSNTSGLSEYTITYIPDGSSTETELVPPTPLVDNGGVLSKFTVSTPVGSCPTGYARYLLKAKIGAGDSLKFADLTATPLELP